MTVTVPSAPPAFNVRLAIAVALLLIAFAFRTLFVDDVPPGITHDEVSSLDVATQVRNGDWRILYPGGFGLDGSEGAYYPFLSAAQSIWGPNAVGRRITSIFAGMIGLALTYALTRRLFGWKIALITLGAASVVWWSIVMGRVILREVLEVPLYALALYAFWRGFEAASDGSASHSLRPFIVAGVALGAAQYVHTIPRGLFLVFVLFGLYLLVVDRTLFKRLWRGILALVVVAEVIATPLLITAASDPDVDHLPDLGLSPSSGELVLVDRLKESVPKILGQFAYAGDDFWNSNIANRPIFEPLGAAVFGLGLLVALWRIRRAAYAFVLIVLFVSLLPSIFLDSHFPFARLVSAQTVAFAFVGLGADALITGLGRVASGRAAPVLASVFVMGLFTVNVVWTAQDMLGVWPVLPATRSTYNADLRDLARYLDAQPQPVPISECTLWIIFPQRPRYHLSVAQAALPYLLERRDLDIRWHDCRYALVIPSSGQFIFAHPDLLPLSNFLGKSLTKPWFENVQPVPGVNGALWVDVRGALAEKLVEWGQLPVSWAPETSEATPARLPINFGNAIELIGYDIQPGLFRPGDNVQVQTYWRATGPLPTDMLAFTHLYRTPTDVMAQQDQLDVEPLDLKPGDIFMQVHEFITLPSDTPAGSYWIGVGLYRKGTGERLPIYVGDRRVGDRIFLDQVQATH